MKSMLRFFFALCAALCFAGCAPMSSHQRVEGSPGGPAYAVDPYWPLPLPNQWILGQVSGIATDRNNHIWVLHRPRTLTEDERGAALAPPRSKCCIPAPPVLEFDASGKLLRAWGQRTSTVFMSIPKAMSGWAGTTPPITCC
jgi:hypothetical protein